MPQETGNHEDVRWAEITDDHGHGMRVSRADGAAPFAVSLLPYSSFMLEEAQHQDELPKPKHMFLRVLAAQMGVGGDDPGCRRCTPVPYPGGQADQPRCRPRADLIRIDPIVHRANDVAPDFLAGSRGPHRLPRSLVSPADAPDIDADPNLVVVEHQ